MSYKLKYWWKAEAHPEGIDRTDGDDAGYCDAWIFVSLIRTPSGGLSTAWTSRDGAKGDGPDMALEPGDLFKAWCSIAHTLSRILPSGSWEQVIAKRTFEAVRHFVLKGRPMVS